MNGQDDYRESERDVRHARAGEAKEGGPVFERQVGWIELVLSYFNHDPIS